MLRHALHFGPYATPRFRIGQRVEDERRGPVRIVGVSDGPIPWPIGQTLRAKSLVLYRGLARAVRREGALAVAHWWGVGRATVHQWRRAVKAPRWTEGDLRLKSAIGKQNVNGIAAMQAAQSDPARIAKIAAALRGRPRPRHVIQAMRKANLGRKLTTEHRGKIAAGIRGLRRKPPAAGERYNARDLRLIRTLPPADAAKQTGRSLAAIYKQRARLRYRGVSDGPATRNRHRSTAPIAGRLATNPRSHQSTPPHKCAYQYMASANGRNRTTTAFSGQ